LKTYKSGFVRLIGQTNVGKSTFINEMVGEKIAIVTNKQQTTRTQIKGILTNENYQIVFVDTPGIHKIINQLNKKMLRNVFAKIEESDLVLFMVGPKAMYPELDEKIKVTLEELRVPIILVITKGDLLSENERSEIINYWSEKLSLEDSIVISSRTRENLFELEQKIVNLLPEGPMYYNEDDLSDVTNSFFIAEIIREKAFISLQNELPYNLGVEIIDLISGKDKIIVYATIIVSKKSHKGMVIGKNGEMIKTIGKYARKDLEKIYKKKVYLDLKVKINEKWINKKHFIKKYNYG